MGRDLDPQGAQPEDFVKVMGGKTPSKYTDPCQKAAKMSMRCLEDNHYDRTRCSEAFANYRKCKELWIAQRRSDRTNGRADAFD